MSDLDTKFLQLAKEDELADETIRMTSIIPKFEGILCRHWMQYAIVDQELQRVTLLPSFLQNMESVMRYIKAAETIHREAIEMFKDLPKND